MKSVINSYWKKIKVSQANRTGTAGLTEISAYEIPRQFIIRTPHAMDVPSFIFVVYKSPDEIILRTIYFRRTTRMHQEKQRDLGGRTFPIKYFSKCLEDHRYNEIHVFRTRRGAKREIIQITQCACV